MFTLQRVSEILLRACVHEECLIRVREMYIWAGKDARVWSKEALILKAESRASVRGMRLVMLF